MARPRKTGLSYFPLDCSWDKEMSGFLSIHGNDGLSFMISFWQDAYSTDEGNVDYSGLFGSIAANNSRITNEQFRIMIHDAINLHLMKHLGDEKYTSDGIQKRLYAINAGREKARNRAKNELFGEKPPNNSRITGEKESKKEIKKEIKKESKKEKENKNINTDRSLFDVKTCSDKNNQQIDQKYIDVAEHLYKRISERRQINRNGSKINDWAKEVRLMVERDKRDISAIVAIIDECHDMLPTASGFSWRDNILSMAKLRERWNEGKIYIGMTKPAKEIQKKYFGREYVSDEFLEKQAKEFFSNNIDRDEISEMPDIFQLPSTEIKNG